MMITAALALALASAPPPPAPDSQPDWFATFGVEKPKPDPVTGELPVAPYVQSDSNAGATPFTGDAMARAFGGQAGIRRMTNDFVAISIADPRIKPIFAATDLIRFRRTLYEQFCYLLGAGCHYSGRDMVEAHKQLGIMTREMNALVEDLQRAMRQNHVAFAAQNRFLSKLAPMSKDVIRR